MARILILGVKIPFTRGGQDVLVESLQAELIKRGHECDILELPFSPLPKENLLKEVALWRSLEIESFGGKPVDLVIATKFPSYYARHARKSLWLVHQHRAIYDLYGGRYSDFSDDPRDEELRRLLHAGDNKVIGECTYRAAISKNVAKRLKQFNQLEAQVLYPPLADSEKYYSAKSEPYILSVGRLCAIKRVDLMLKAMPMVHNFVKLKIVGTADEAGTLEYYKNEIDKHHLWERVEFLGRVNQEELRELYAKSMMVYYAPHNEDYGYVTLEAMASAKPVLTAFDSGGVLEFVRHEENGLLVEANSDALAKAANRLIENPELAQDLGQRAEKAFKTFGVCDSDWEALIGKLLSPLQIVKQAQIANA